MNYRHGYHAGNFADVVKHLALVGILLHLRKKDTAFAVVDSHAGRGRYDLRGTEAGKTGEAEVGIGRLRGDFSGIVPEALAAYLSLAREDNSSIRARRSLPRNFCAHRTSLRPSKSIRQNSRR